MGRGAVAGRGHIDLARIGLGIGDELGNGLAWERLGDHHAKWGLENARDGGDVTNKIEFEIRVECRVDYIRWDGQKQRVPARRRFYDALSGDIAPTPGGVLKNNLWAEP